MTARSLADALRGSSDEALAELLGARPELVSPVPADLGQLAARATTAPSVARALDRLDRWTLQVLEAVCAVADPSAADPPTYAQVRALLPQAGDTDVRVAVDRLLTLALLWGDDDRLNVVGGVRDVIGTHPGGLGPSLRTLLA
ncbi:MAG TPA: DNA-binding protein, partial [Actinomycetes bacterium]